MKQRFNYLDIRTAVNELHPKIESTYIQNIYSSGQRTFYVRTNKNIFLIEAGLRIHLTDTYPSNEISFFCKRLRTCLRRKKIGGVKQVGFDRVVVVQAGEFLVVVEMFAAGNLIVLEKESVASERNSGEEDEKDRNGLERTEYRGNGPITEIYDGEAGKMVIDRNGSGQSDNMIDKSVRIYEKKEEQPKKESKVKKRLRESIVKGVKTQKTVEREKVDLNDIYDVMNKYRIVEIFRPVSELNMVKGSYYVFNPIQLNFRYSFFQSVDTFVGLDKEVNEFIGNILKVQIGRARNSGNLENTNKNCEMKSLSSGKIAQQSQKDDRILKAAAFKEYMNNVDLKNLAENEIAVFEAFFTNLRTIFKANKDYGAIIEKKGKAANYLCLDFNVIDPEGDFLECYPPGNLKIFGSFNECVNTFYSGSKKMQSKVNLSKRDKVRMQQLKYVQEIENEENELRKAAIIIGMARDDISRVFKVLNYVKNNKISWEMFFKQKAEERDPLYRESIQKVDFMKNEVLMRIFYDGNMFDENGERYSVSSGENNTKKSKRKAKAAKDTIEDRCEGNFEKDMTERENSEMSKRCYKDVLLFYRLSIDKNVNYYYNQMKSKKTKREKIRNNLESILANISEKKATVKQREYKKRELFWFEKFNFTVTQNGFLVLGGKNATQNETLNKRKFKLFFHADVKGGSVVTVDGTKLNILRRNTGYAESSSVTSIKRLQTNPENVYGLKEEDITDASQMCMVNSNCWKDRIVCDSYYVNEEQVSKSAPSGEFLTKGGFMVKGKKNYVHNVRLEYAVGLLFALEKGLEHKLESMHIGSDVDHGQSTEPECDDKQMVSDSIAGNLNGDNAAEKSIPAANYDIPIVFTYSPTETDNISLALPIAGSWDTFKAYKFAIKIVPGRNIKKGKLMKEVLDSFMRRANESEKSVIKRIDATEWMNVLLGDARISK
ncbi:hypothetical protein VCUG_02190 [Vavraia culicis subsp. floridensis]|uniref:NFACT RNA-binding domain-containing protein n=1 Tax=Vavraia culicis (isolate floridensis) TaxID=948595 RepID=L2GSF7_VAVCU|nr:uncharacterized protein VCUG_02190 [Vavraia culicis subsp. floridensis]ELA46302.1 hypothetical protein VCUG_02190 [Vavraia culicis subsp. floridensis]